MANKQLLEKIKKEHPNFLPSKQEELAERLTTVDEKLRPNIREWLNDQPLSDVYVNDRYCVRSVMKMYGDKNFVRAIILLDNYLKDSETEGKLVGGAARA